MKANTLKKIEADIAAGDYGKARDRLHGLIATYPDDLTLRQKLGDVYWKLQYPAMAGRYWYLEEDKASHMMAACRIFEQSCGLDPLQMLLALKFRGNVENIRDTFAGRALLALQDRAKEGHGCYVQFGERGSKKYRYTSRIESKSKWMIVGCLVALVIALGVMIIGVATIWQWIF